MADHKGIGTMNKKAILVFLVFAAGVLNAAGLKAPGYDNLISHRGESADAPENTLAAFKCAVDRGFGFECDIYLSKDKKLFAFHDSSLSRITEGVNTQLCTNLSWEDTLSKLNVAGWGKWKGSKFDPCRPALLSEILALARDGRYIYVEIKGDNPSWVPYIKRELEAAENATPENVLFITFSRKVAAQLKKAIPEYKTYLLARVTRMGEETNDQITERIISILKRLKVDGIDVFFNESIITKEFVDKVKAAGFSVHVWTIDTASVAKEAFARGVDTLTTNRAKFILEQSSK